MQDFFKRDDGLPWASALEDFRLRQYLERAFERVLDAGPSTRLVWLTFGNPSRCSGELDLGFGGVGSSRIGFVPPYPCKMRGMSMAVNKADGSRRFRLDLLRDPGGAKDVVDELNLDIGEAKASRSDYKAELSTAYDYGLRVIRTSGAGDSDWEYITAVLALSMTVV